jgi:hypothetical protein
MAARQPTKPAAADGFVSRKSEIATAETVPTTGSIRWKLASMMPTRSPLACGKSWPSAPPGQVAAPTFCVPALVGAVASLRGTVTGWPKNTCALAGRLRREQTFLRALGIEITFSRKGRSGSRIIRIRPLKKILSARSATMGAVSRQA